MFETRVVAQRSVRARGARGRARKRSDTDRTDLLVWQGDLLVLLRMALCV
jgi:hypothetical protein